jgi:ribosomal protein S18 acetylase RimI-like enzyme
VQYQETYYKDVVERKDEGLCKFAYWNGFVIGAACARLENMELLETTAPETTTETTTETPDTPSSNISDVVDDSSNPTPPPPPPVKQRLYIMTLGVLAAYRGRTIGTQLIQTILDHYEENNVVEISLHVQISNEDAIQFYTKRFGFEKGPMVENYYRRIDPPHCYLLYKTLR